MNFCILSLNDQNYQPLADLTWEQNKVKYAEKNDYAYACKRDNFYNVIMGYEKMYFIRDMMEGYPEIDWFWWTGCDTLITNFNIKLEDVVDNDYHFIIAPDCDGINADSFFVRNSPEGKKFVDVINSKIDTYKTHGWVEQQAIIEHMKMDEFKDMVKVVPQRQLNAYDYALYPDCKPIDLTGNDGQWKPGDLLIHWPGRSLWERLQLAPKFMQQVVE